MRFTLVFSALFALALTAAPVTAQQQAQDQAEPDLPRVLIIGDSISQGYHREVLRLTQGVADVTRIPGNAEYTGTGVLRIDDWLGDTDWDVIHFNWGLWDMYGWAYHEVDRSPLAYEARLEHLVRRLERTGAHLIWATTTPACPGPEVTMLNRWHTQVVISPELEQQYLDAAARVMARHHIQVNDLHALAAPQLETISPDPADVHYTREGSELLAQQVADVITRAVQANQ